MYKECWHRKYRTTVQWVISWTTWHTTSRPPLKDCHRLQKPHVCCIIPKVKNNLPCGGHTIAVSYKGQQEHSKKGDDWLKTPLISSASCSSLFIWVLQPTRRGTCWLIYRRQFARSIPKIQMTNNWVLWNTACCLPCNICLFLWMKESAELQVTLQVVSGGFKKFSELYKWWQKCVLAERQYLKDNCTGCKKWLLFWNFWSYHISLAWRPPIMRKLQN